MKTRFLPFVPALFLFACDKPASKDPVDAHAPEAAAPVVSASASASAAASAASVDAGDAADGGKKVLVLRWSATKAPSGSPRVAVSLKAGENTIAIGELDATSDDPSNGSPKTCRNLKTNKSLSEFVCGGVPAYNFFTASLEKNELVIRKVTGTEGEKNEKKTEVKRIAVTESELRTLKFKPVTAPAAAAAPPKCPAGQEASDFTGEWRCAPTCTTDADCKAGSYCQVRHNITPDGKIGAVMGSACESD